MRNFCSFGLFLQKMSRTHHCNALTGEDAGKTVTLAGWIDSARDHGGILFVDLRDREGRTQVVFDPRREELKQHFSSLRPESVVEVTGKVAKRPDETVNRKIATGEIEIQVESLVVHNVSETPPFPMDDSGDRVNEDLRLNYRYLDLRRPRNLRNLRLRHEAAQAVRAFFNENGFLEVETPTLFKSTPEGAREFLVPSRLNAGSFYALPQSPQQFKQMLMVAGVEKYYQIARCYRDEDLRADRQPEFTQVDLEVSFIDREGMYALIEGLLQRVWRDVRGTEIETPFPRMTYLEAMNRFGVDKPDLRFGFELADLGDLFAGTEFKVFRGALESGGALKAVNIKGLADITQGEMKALEDTAKSLGARGLAYIQVREDGMRSPILKFLSEAEQEGLREKMGMDTGDILFFAAAPWEQACSILGRIRLEAAALLRKRGKLEYADDDFRFLWVTDFPLMIHDEEQGRYVSAHHPFTSPVPEDIPLLDSEPKAVRGQHYDVVLNGVELGGGSIRIHQPDLQKKVFEDVLKIPPEVVESRFGYFLKAFRFGAPPHGGLALGFDRMVAILAGRPYIRDVIAFPKTQKGQDLMAEAPSQVTAKQLRDLHISLLERE